MRASGLLTSVSIFIVAGVPLFGCPAFAQASDEEVSNPAPASTAEANAVRDSNAAESGGLEDIIVTARRSSEALQTTPVAVTALTPASLDRAQITAVADLQRTAPSLSIATGGGAPTSIVFVAIRGQGQNEPTTATDPAVGIYVDGVYIARPTGSNLDLIDVARVEVLRGPQGTLFGRNTVGGAISLTTNAPTGDFEGSVKASVGNYDYRRYEGVLNIPLMGDELAVRFAGSYNERDGYGRFVRLDRPAADVRGNYYVRGQLRWAPADKPFTLTVSGDYTRFRDSGQLTGLVGYNPDFELSPGFTVGDAVAGTGIDPNDYLLNKKNFYSSYGYNDTGEADLDKPQNRSSGKGVSATLDVDLGGANLQSITAYREAKSGDTLDIDSLPINLVSFIAHTRQKQFSEELQLSGTSGRLEWIGGLYYFIEKGYEEADAKSFSILDPNAKVFRNTSGDARSVSKAIYGQINYHLTDRLRATGGLRYTWDSRKLVLHTRLDRDTLECAIPADQRDIPGGACNRTRDIDFDYPAWTAGLDYKVNDSMFVYAKTSGASMAGGWNLRDSIAPAFKPENVRDVEAGFKADLFDRKLRFNVAIFHAWQSDVQRNIRTFDPVFQSLTSYTTNAGKARSYGAEFEATVLPWKGMEVTGSLSLLRAKYVKGTFNETQIICVDGADRGLPSTACVGQNPIGTLKPFDVDRSGEKIPQAPRLTWNIGATQVIPISFGQLSVHADYAYISRRAAYQNTAADQATQNVKDQYELANRVGIIPAYGLLNARVTLNLDSPVMELSVWGRNITRKRYLTNVADFITSFGVAEGSIGEPRTYGVTLGYRF